MCCSTRRVKATRTSLTKIQYLPVLLMLFVVLRDRPFLSHITTIITTAATVFAFQTTTRTSLLVSIRKSSFRKVQHAIRTGISVPVSRVKPNKVTALLQSHRQTQRLTTETRNMHSSHTPVVLCATTVPSIGNSNAAVPPNDATNDDNDVNSNVISDTETNGTTTNTMNGYGIDMDQNALMETDMLVAVDDHDHLVPNVVLSKKVGHTFNAVTPRATLHRAFSLFIFNSDQELLLTQRAASKITFPNVWTNTVCSHPLYGMTPNEADIVPDAYPHFPGIKQAALRKCQHELGIPMSCLDPQRMQFVTRFHYWAADTITYGNTDACPWGEHEVDYILFYQLPPPPPSSSSDNNGSGTTNRVLPISPNPEEVSDYKYVSIDELRNTMFQDPNLLWSPWFRGIMDRGGFDWWEQLPKAMTGIYTNDQITYFDPPLIHAAPYNLPTHTKSMGVLSTTTTVDSTTTNDDNNENGHTHK